MEVCVLHKFANKFHLKSLSLLSQQAIWTLIQCQIDVEKTLNNIRIFWRRNFDIDLMSSFQWFLFSIEKALKKHLKINIKISLWCVIWGIDDLQPIKIPQTQSKYFAIITYVLTPSEHDSPLI